MTDRRAAQRAAVRADVVAAAWDVARTNGFAALTLRDVAARVGMRAPSLYTHFPSKMAIVDAMFEQAWTAYRDSTAALEADLPDAPRAALAAAATHFFDFATADPARHQLMNRAAVPGFTPSPEAYRPAVETYDRLVATLQRMGLDDPAAADMVTAVFGGFVDQQLANDPGGDRWRRLLDRAVDMLADALGLPGPSLSRSTPRGRRPAPAHRTTRPRRTAP